VGGARLDFSYLKQVCESAQQSVFPFNLSTLLQCKFQTVAPPDATFRDRRIAAVLAVNPVGSAVFGPLGLAQIDVPVMVVGGSDDRITPATEEQIYPFTWLQAPEKYLVMVDGGTHFSFLRGRDKGIAALPDRLVGPNPAIAHGYLQALSTAFLQTYLNHRPQYAAYLSDSYLQTLCEDDPFQLTVTRSLGQQQVLRAVNASGSLYLGTLVSLTESLVARSPITEWKATILQDRPLAKPPADGQSVKAMVSDQPKAIAATNRRETVAIDPAFSRSHE
jgi:predicted dienelactone hydrolase